MLKKLIVAGVVGVLSSAAPAQTTEAPRVTELQKVEVTAPMKTRIELLPLNV